MDCVIHEITTYGFAVPCVDAKSDYEEMKLIDTYGLSYEEYMIKVQGKFYPLVNFTIN